MTTSSTAIFIPFMTRELRMGGQALYYGMNALSHNVIMADRKKLKSANGLYLGSTGSGKSFGTTYIRVGCNLESERTHRLIERRMTNDFLFGIIHIVSHYGRSISVSYTHLEMLWVISNWLRAATAASNLSCNSLEPNSLISAFFITYTF